MLPELAKKNHSEILTNTLILEKKKRAVFSFYLQLIFWYYPSSNSSKIYIIDKDATSFIPVYKIYGLWFKRCERIKKKLSLGGSNGRNPFFIGGA
jgi:hypothetical protein